MLLLQLQVIIYILLLQPLIITCQVIKFEDIIRENYFSDDVNETCNLNITSTLSPQQPIFSLVGCCPKCWDIYVMREFYYLFNNLISLGWNEPSIYELQKNISNINASVPSVLLFCETSIQLFDFLNISKAKERGIHIALWADDLHTFNRYNEEFLLSSLSLVHTFIGTYAYRFKDYLYNLLVKYNISTLPKQVWIPHSASPPFLKHSINEFPIKKIFLSGAITRENYPLRLWLMMLAQENQHLIYQHFHPGYGHIYKEQQSIEYASKLNSFLASYTCGGMEHFIIAKIFEIPATGSLLLVNQELEDLLSSLGLTNGIDYLGYEASNPLNMIEYIFNEDNLIKINQIRKEGQKKVKMFHKTEDRAKVLHNYFINGKEEFKIPEIYRKNLCPTILHKTKEECLQEIKRTQYHYTPKDLNENFLGLRPNVNI